MPNLELGAKQGLFIGGARVTSLPKVIWEEGRVAVTSEHAAAFG